MSSKNVFPETCLEAGDLLVLTTGSGDIHYLSFLRDGVRIKFSAVSEDDKVMLDFLEENDFVSLCFLIANLLGFKLEPVEAGKSYRLKPYMPACE